MPNLPLKFSHPPVSKKSEDGDYGYTDLEIVQSSPSLDAFMSLLPVQRYDHRDGLKSLQIHKTVTSLDGRIWCATPSGLACLDGVSIYMFDRKHGLSSHGLRTLAVQDDNSLWIGTDIGVDVLDIGELVPKVIWTAKVGTVNSLDISKSFGAIGTSHGLYFWRGGELLQRSQNSSLAKATIRSVLVAPDEKVWATGPRIGLVQIDKDENTQPVNDAAGSIYHATAINLGPNNTILVGGPEGVWNFDLNGLSTANYPTDNNIDALMYYDGFIWVAAGHLLSRLRYEQGQIVYHDTVHNNVSALGLMADAFDNVWISTGDQALLRISRMRNTLGEKVASDIGAIMCIRRYETDLWVGGSNGLRRADGGTILAGLTVWDVVVDDLGKTWIATAGGLYCTVNPNYTIPYRHVDCDVIAAPCRTLSIYNDKLYVASTRGLAKIDSQGASEVFGPDQKALGYVYSLHVDRLDRMWIATLGQGLFRMDGDDVIAFTFEGLEDHANVYALTHDDDGNVYVSHGNRITKIDPEDGATTIIETDIAIAAWTLKCLKAESLVAGTSNGLIVYDIVDGNILHQLSGNFDEVPWEFTTSRSLEISDDNTLYCGLGSGLRIVKLNELDESDRMPVASFSYAHWRGETPIKENGKTKVTTGHWHLEVGLRTVWFLDDCTMRVRIDGFDNDWSDFTKIGPIHLNTLPAGSYSIAAQIYSPIAGLGPETTIYTFSVD